MNFDKILKVIFLITLILTFIFAIVGTSNGLFIEDFDHQEWFNVFALYAITIIGGMVYRDTVNR